MDILNFLLALGSINVMVICVRLLDALLVSHNAFKDYCYCNQYRRNHFVTALAFFITNLLGTASVILLPIESGMWQITAGLNLFAQTIGLSHLLIKEKNRHKYHKCKRPNKSNAK